jgi:hypothetical protein
MTAVENLGETMFEMGRWGDTDPEKPCGKVVDPASLTREQLLSALKGNYLLQRDDGGFTVVTNHSIELGEFGFAEDDEGGIRR